jgi:acyl-CoA synthetase (AMP-forming)/AMP-acid ligase II
VGGIRALASGLAARGFGKGDVLAVYMPNLPEYAIAFHGATSAGGKATTMNPLYTANEVAHQLEDSGAKLLITIGPFLEAAKEAAESAGIGDEVHVVGEGDGAKPFTELLGDPAEAPQVEIDPGEDIAVLPYSSGTTGLPKGVMLTHRNLVANLLQTRATQEVDPDDVLIGVLPFFHIYGMQVIMNLGLREGATVVTMPRFDLDQFRRSRLRSPSTRRSKSTTSPR